MAKAFSIEDTNLNSSLLSSRNTSYKDIDLSFTNKPSGEIYKKTDAAAVKQAVKNLLMTARGEKPFQPHFGADLNDALFNLDTEFEAEYIQNLMFDAIEAYEPRARVLNIRVSPQPDYNSLDASIEFQVVNTKEIVSVEVSLARLR